MQHASRHKDVEPHGQSRSKPVPARGYKSFTYHDQASQTNPLTMCFFQVLVLSKVRHPNIIVLLGVCSQSCSLVYEYLSNGSLDERLARKNGTLPLSWQDRVRIIAEQRSALIYLHSHKPHAIIHSDLKMANILLDANNVSRLGDFGAAQLIRQDGSDKAILCQRTTAMGTMGYIDPMFLIHGELTPSSDVYSFGIIILRLLTGLPVLKIAEVIQKRLQNGSMRRILDASAGEWPLVHTELAPGSEMLQH